MKLSEIAPDSIINVLVSKEDSSISLTTTMAFYDEDILFVNPFLYEDNIVSFDVPDLNVEMMVVRENEVPYYWKRVHVGIMKIDGNTYHAISSRHAGVRLNRRNSFRVFVGEEGSAQFQLRGGDKLPILVKDISATGIGFLVQGDDDEYFQPGDQVHINYIDKEERFGIDVVGRVVRSTSTEKGRLYGCSFSKVYPQINKYVTDKQIHKKKSKGLPAFMDKK
ncbi:MAG: PilZ domain-containing protein [Lachnospiraceae bacterium]|nr:PilZ domain-containing protein [Lachnospiraceae bacterium]MBR5896457.1 PilZ domain-containing protein [Lachnospiraceae bacterium]